MDAAAFLHGLISSPDYEQQIVHIQHILSQDARSGELNKLLNPALRECLESLGISALYSHQAQALDAIFAGKNVIVATASASGKTLCYHLATLEAILDEKDSSALYIFPTKALAQDQLRGLKEIACPKLLTEETVAAFDGDTPQAERANIRKQAKVVLTNPDMLHFGILPNHQSWSKLLRKLSYVVLDEAHIYRGIFGSHVANVLRRFRRLCAFYGSSPQFICCSATIANPKEHAQNLTGLPFDEIVEDGSFRGEKYFAFWNPPVVDEAKSSRRSSNSEAAFLLSQLIQNDIRTIALVAGVLLLLSVVTGVGQFLKRHPDRGIDAAAVRTFNMRIRGWWVLCTVLAAAFWLGSTATVTLFGFVSFWALREFITLTPTRKGDHRALF